MNKEIRWALVLPWALFLIKLALYYDMMELPENWNWLILITFGGYLLLFEATLWKRKSMDIIFVICYTMLCLIMAADTIYYDYFGQFISINQLWQVESLLETGTKTNLVGALSIPWGLLFLVDIPFMCHWHRERAKERKKPWVSLVALVGLFVFSVNIGVVAKNETLNGDYMRIDHLEFIACHTNDIMTKMEEQKQKENIDPEEVKAIIRENVPQATKQELRGIAKGKNLILIQVESLNGWVIGKEIDGQEITPHLNRLLQNDSLYFSNVFSSSGKGNTSDAEFATLNSLYPTTVRECYRMYVNNTYNGIPWILRSLGYETMAFHGYDKEFWNRNIAYKNQGIQTFYSQEELDMTEVSGFGLTDKELFRQAVDILKEKKEPWFSFMITLTNHIPYELENSLVSMKVPAHLEGTLTGNYIKAVRYTDEAIGLLMDYLKEAGLYENTIIALYGDHQGLNKETESVSNAMEQVLGRTYDYDEMMRVPFLIHIPGMQEAREIDTVGGQVDIMPTLANLMDFTIEQDYVFGSDLLNIERQEGFYAPVTYMPVGSFAVQNIMYELGRDGTATGGIAIELHSGRNLDISGVESYIDRARLLIDTSKKVLDGNLMSNIHNKGQE